MDKSFYNLQDFLCKNYDLYLQVVELLDADNNWRRVVSAFKNYKIPVVFSERDIKKMETSTSPSRYLLIELQNRFCCVGVFCEILRACDLLEILALIADPEPIEIVLQPGEKDESMTYFAHGGELKLECRAVGLPPPKYLWHHINSPLEDQTGPVLHIQEFTDDHVGDYYCVVSHSVNGEICSKLSNTVIADIMPEAPTLIDDLPRQVTVPQEECVILTVNATGRPPPIFQWVMNNSILDNETSNSLRVCEVHFRPQDIQRFIEGYNEEGKKLEAPLKRIKLKEGAIPVIFPNCPDYLSAPSTSRESAEERRIRNDNENLQTAIQESLTTKDEYVLTVWLSF